MLDYYTVKPPVSRKLGPDSPILVRHDSPRFLHRYVETLACYFQKELHYDSVSFKAREAPEDARFEAWLFHKQADDYVTDEDYEKGGAKMPRRVVGVVCFRQFEDDLSEQWTLEWTWFHPYERGRTELLSLWPKFKDRYGKFGIESPVSQAMHGFLAKVDRLAL